MKGVADQQQSADQQRNNHSKTEASEWKPYFPAKGAAVDVCVYDTPCMQAQLQWWYGNAQLRIKGEQEEEKRFGFFASFFLQRQNTTPKENPVLHDACTWAVIDNKEQRYYADVLLDHKSINEIRRRIDPDMTGEGAPDIESALLEVMKKGNLPRPDRLMKKTGTYVNAPFEVNYDDECIITRTDNNDKSVTYRFRLSNPVRDVEVDLLFTSANSTPVLHGEDGVVNGMFYYYFPAMTVQGSLRIGDKKYTVEGDGWYDREFGGDGVANSQDAVDAWSWVSLRFSNSSQFSLYRISSNKTGKLKELAGVFTSKSGQRQLCNDVIFEEAQPWTSVVTFLSYPSKFTLSVPSLGLKCSFCPTFASQEFVTLLVSGCGFFEGCIVGHGRLDDNQEEFGVTGFLEYKNGIVDNSTTSMMNRVSKFVKNALHEMYPLQSDAEWVQQNVLGRHAIHTASQSQKVCDTLFAPVRSLIDRGGKSWRSLILVTGCNALSRDYFDCTKYIAMAELLHVGSLIIDDIEDNSVVRRGGQCVHIEHGLPTAINAGTACYFMAPQLAEVHKLPPAKANKIYQLYFDVLRAGHAGQGLDIFGLDYLMPDVVKTGNATPLLEALEAIHIYKTGGAAGSICTMACVLCDADDTVTAAMEKFGVSIGLAFQIVDDALNLRGFEGNLKEVGEDVREGKITYPIAKAMGKLSQVERETMWSILKEKTDDASKIGHVIDLVNQTGAVTECLTDARRLVENSWDALNPLLEDSFSKNVMYTFCKFLTNRSR